MTEKNLAYYLKNPGEAHKIPESDLRSWLDLYPYSSGVRWLKARKDLHTSNPNAEDSIAKAATYANDLCFLRYQLLRNPENETEMVRQLKGFKPPAIEEEPIKVVESKTTPAVKISKPQKEETKPKPVEKKAVPTENAKVEKQTDLVKKEDKIDKREDPKPVKNKSEKTPQKPKSQDTKQKEEKTKEITNQHAEIVDRILKQEQERFSDFTSWLLSLDQTEGQPKEVSAKKKLKQPKASKKKKEKGSKKKGKKSRLKKLIDQSLAAQDEAVSETYADLLATQGYSDRAIELYQKLMLIYPEKSGYFAAKIENLEKS